MNNLDQVPEHLKGPLLAELEKLQMEDSFRLYNGLVEQCFNRCVGAFHGKKLDAAEDKCVSTCATKFTNFSKRVGQRWQEAQAEAQEEMVSKVQSMAAASGAPASR